MHQSKVFVATFILLIILDALWLGVFANSIYIREIGYHLRLNGDKLDPIWIVAMLVYVLIAIGIIVFVWPRSETLMMALGLGAIYGFIIYGVYDLTNFALMTHWPLKMVVIDITYGTISCAIASAFAKLVSPFLE